MTGPKGVGPVDDTRKTARTCFGCFVALRRLLIVHAVRPADRLYPAEKSEDGERLSFETSFSRASGGEIAAFGARYKYGARFNLWDASEPGQKARSIRAGTINCEPAAAVWHTASGPEAALNGPSLWAAAATANARAGRRTCDAAQWPTCRASLAGPFTAAGREERGSFAKRQFSRDFLTYAIIDHARRAGRLAPPKGWGINLAAVCKECALIRCHRGRRKRESVLAHGAGRKAAAGKPPSRPNQTCSELSNIPTLLVPFMC